MKNKGRKKSRIGNESSYSHLDFRVIKIGKLLFQVYKTSTGTHKEEGENYMYRGIKYNYFKYNKFIIM